MSRLTGLEVVTTLHLHLSNYALFIKRSCIMLVEIKKFLCIEDIELELNSKTEPEAWHIHLITKQQH